MGIEAAEVLAVEIKSNAWKEGFEEGQRAASEEMGKILRESTQSVEVLLREIADERDHMFDTLEREAVLLVLEVAKKVINQVVVEDKELFTSMMIRAVQELKSKRQLTIRVSPEVAERFFPGGRAEFQLGDRTVNASVIPDIEYTGADLIVESEDEIINAGAETQLHMISLKFSEPAE